VVRLRQHLDVEPLAPDAVRDHATVLSGYTGPGYADPDEGDIETILRAGRSEGLILDPSYTGKAFRAFLEESRAGERNLFIHTGGSYGLFPQRERLTKAIVDR
jgi:D-cysteine desulfhydrase